MACCLASEKRFVLLIDIAVAFDRRPGCVLKIHATASFPWIFVAVSALHSDFKWADVLQNSMTVLERRSVSQVRRV